MSFTKEKVDQIKKYILEKIEDGQGNIAKRTTEAFATSSNTVYRYIREMEEDGWIVKAGRKLSLAQTHEQITLHRGNNDILEEDIIYEQYVEKYIIGLPDNVRKIWQYSFMEMMNNAIDHSQATMIFIDIVQTYLTTRIAIGDNGIGIFQKICDYYGYESLDDAVNELFKGKLTTDANHHSGEGIFFTSRALDMFAALSSGKIFTHDKYNEIITSFGGIDNANHANVWKQGTIILMELSNFSRKSIKEVFDMFSDPDGGFTRTRIPIRNIYETYPVSRSQAKRLCHRFEKFAIVELDFSDIADIGQGFAHELFFVFQNNHPNCQLIPINANDNILKMINHVKNTNI